MPLRTNSSDEAEQEQPERLLQRSNEDEAGTQRHRDEAPEGDARTAQSVSEPTTDRPGQRAEERPEERQLRRLQGSGELGWNCTCKTCPKAKLKPMNEPKVPM